jgi:hypothetical protein
MRNYLEAKEKQSFENQIPKDAKSQKSMERKREKKSLSDISGSSRGMGEVLVKKKSQAEYSNTSNK